jgi:hypothetical protein
MDASSTEALGWLLTTGIIWIAVVAVIFLVIRQVVLWYFRVNQMADDLHAIANHFRAIEQKEAQGRIAALQRSAAVNPPAPIRPSP